MSDRNFNILMVTFVVAGSISLLIGIIIGIVASIEMESLPVNSDRWFDEYFTYINCLWWLLGGKVIFSIAELINDARKDK